MDSHVVFKIDSGGKKKNNTSQTPENPHMGWGRKVTMVTCSLMGQEDSYGDMSPGCPLPLDHGKIPGVSQQLEDLVPFPLQGVGQENRH